MTTSGTTSIHPKGLIGLLVFLLCALVASAKPEHFDIPAQAAPSALKLFNKQSSKPAVFITDDVKDVQSSEVKGDFEPSDALTRLLNNTGYEITKTTSVNFVIGRAVAHDSGSVRGSIVGEGGRGLADVLVAVRETAQSTSTDKFGGYFFPKLKPGTYTLVATTSGYQPMHITDVQIRGGSDLLLGREEMHKALGDVTILEPFVVRADPVEQLEKIEVTDSKPKPFSDRNVDLPRTVNDVQPYYIFNAQTIEESGATDVEDFLRQRLTMNTTVMTNSQTSLYRQGNQLSQSINLLPTTTSSINLNGLGADHTLVLINGMPMPGVRISSLGNSPPGQPDINGIPLGAIDRIEVLPSSAGALYGAGAEGGVINIILKKAYNGGDLTATYASTWDGHAPSETISATFGKSFENGKTQIFLSAQYSTQSPMFVGDRANLLDRGFSRLLINDPSFVTSVSSTPNLYSPILGATPNIASASASYPVPVGTPGVAASNQTKPIGTRTGSGQLTTAANPWILTEVVPLTLKSTGQSLSGANPYIATLPVGYSISSNPGSIIGGQWNLDHNPTNEGPNGLLVPLGNYPRRKTFMGTVTRQMAENFQMHFDYLYTDNSSRSYYNPFGTFSSGIIFVPADTPSNPFNQAVNVAAPINYTASANSHTRTTSVTLGGTLKLPFNWLAHFDYQWAQSASEAYYAGQMNILFSFPGPTYFSSGLNSYLGIPDNYPPPLFTGAINPFVDTVAHPLDLSPYTMSQFSSTKNIENELVIAASGPLFHLPWGDARLSLRMDHNYTKQPAGAVSSFLPSGNPPLGMPVGGDFGVNAETDSYFARSQTVDIANAQLDLPIFKSKLPFLRSLDAQMNFGIQSGSVVTGTPGIATFPAYTYSTYPNGAVFLLGPNSVSTGMQPLAAYTDQTGASVPASAAKPITIKSKNTHTSLTGPALSYRPFDDIIFRASIADGYVAPTYTQLVPNTSNLSAPRNTNIADPVSGTSYNVPVYSLGGNPDLKPTTSKSWDFGVIWEPKWTPLRGLRVDAEYVQTNQQNLILAPAAQTIVSFESNFPGLVTRDSTGHITSITTENINIAGAKQSAWTYTLDYSKNTPIGSFGLTAAETIQEHVKQQLVVGTNYLEFVGFPNSGGVAKTKSTATLRWSFHNWVAAWTVVNFGGYYQFGAAGDPGPYATALEKGQTYTLNTKYTVAQGSNTIPSQTYHNIYLSYSFGKNVFARGSRLGRWANDVFNDMKVSLVVNNVFNSYPPFDVSYQPFYASPYGDLELRNYSITLKKSF